MLDQPRIIKISLILSFAAMGCARQIAISGNAGQFLKTKLPESGVQARSAYELRNSLGVNNLVNSANWSSKASHARAISLLQGLGIRHVRLEIPKFADPNLSAAMTQSEEMLSADIDPLLTTLLRNDGSPSIQQVPVSDYPSRAAFACIDSCVDGLGNAISCTDLKLYTDPNAKVLSWNGQDCETTHATDWVQKEPGATYTFSGVQSILSRLEQDSPGATGRVCIEGPNEWADDSHNTSFEMHFLLRDQMKSLVNQIQNGDPSKSKVCIVAPTIDFNTRAGKLIPGTDTQMPKSVANQVGYNNDSINYGGWFDPSLYIPSYAFMKVGVSGSSNLGNAHCYQTPEYYDATVPAPIPGDRVSDPNNIYGTLHNCRFHTDVWKREGVTEFSHFIVSEFGVSSCNEGGGSTVGCFTEKQQASYVPLRWIQMFAQGYRTMFVFKFMSDDTSLTAENSMGMIRSDFTPKPVYNSLHRLTGHILQSSAQFTPSKLDFSLTTEPASGPGFGHLLFQRDDGTFVLILYRKPAALADLNNPMTVPVTFASSVNISTYDIDHDTSISTTQASTLNVALKDISILEIQR